MLKGKEKERVKRLGDGGGTETKERALQLLAMGCTQENRSYLKEMGEFMAGKNRRLAPVLVARHEVTIGVANTDGKLPLCSLRLVKVTNTSLLLSTTIRGKKLGASLSPDSLLQALPVFTAGIMTPCQD